MARVLMNCPSNQDRAVPTGQRMTEAQLASANGVYGFRCIACNEVHQWRRDDVWLEEKATFSSLV